MSGSHCILLENIDIYFSSQLELNTISPGLKKTKLKHSGSVHSLTPTCLALSSWPGLPPGPVPPSLGGWCQRAEKSPKAGQVPGKPLDRPGVGEPDEKNRKEPELTARID